MLEILLMIEQELKLSAQKKSHWSGKSNLPSLGTTLIPAICLYGQPHKMLKVVFLGDVVSIKSFFLNF